MQQISRTMGPAQWTTLVILSILWGGSFFFAEIALAALPPFTIVLLRVGLAAIALHLFLLARGAPVPFGLGLWGAFLVMGLINNVVPFSLLVWGQTQIASGLASILNATTPIFTIVVAHFLTSDEKMTGGRLAGVLIGFGGVAVMIGPAALAGLGANLLAQLACLGATLSYGFAGTFGRRFARMGVTPVQTAAGQVTASALILLPISMAVDRPWTLPMPGMEVMTSVVALALLSTAVAYILFFRLLASAGATNIMLVTLLVPVSAILLGVTILGERLDPEHFAGMALIGLGLAAIDGRPARALGRLVTARSD
jgi:drug/metabolite transporter (DMT)-like permease